MANWQTLLSKRVIIIGGVSVVLAVSLFILAPQELGEKPGPGDGANNGTANIDQAGQAADLVNPTTGREPEPAHATTTGSIVVRAEEKDAIFSVYDQSGRGLTSGRVNDLVSLFSGNYKIKINGSGYQAYLKAGQNAILETGSIVVRAEEKDAIFSVYDQSGRGLTSARVNDLVSLFPGNYKVKINGSEKQASVKAGQNAVLETGSIVVRAGEENAIFSVYDGNGRGLTSARANDPISLFPGTYKLRFQGAERIVSVQAGQQAF